MDRTPPAAVRRALRMEVAFGCPVEGCANPYLEYHHFDPPWHEREHHDAAGMIALCSEHHAKADSGAFTKEQLRALKRPTAGTVAGRFDWLRQDLLAVIGGNFYHETPVIVRFRDQPQIWFTRDEAGHFLLNLRMVSGATEPRLQLDANDWIVKGNPVDFESPPSGRRIFARYENGDDLRVEFLNVANAEEFARRYQHARHASWPLQFPLTAVEVRFRVGGTPIEFGPTSTTLGGVQMTGSYIGRCPVGLHWE